MSISMYQITIRAFIHFINNLTGLPKQGPPDIRLRCPKGPDPYNYSRLA